MQRNNQKAFTMVELIFVIVIIGILAAIAIPKLSRTTVLAYMTKGKSTLATVRSAITRERQKLILRGDTTTGVSIYNATGRVFTRFQDVNGTRILSNDLPSCTDIGCWEEVSTTSYKFYTDNSGTHCTYTLSDNRFTASSSCSEIED